MPLTPESASRKDKRNGSLDSMQHRHYAGIASIIAAMPDHAATLRSNKRSVALTFADALNTNSNFDRARFLRACGYEAGQ